MCIRSDNRCRAMPAHQQALGPSAQRPQKVRHSARAKLFKRGRRQGGACRIEGEQALIKGDKHGNGAFIGSQHNATCKTAGRYDCFRNGNNRKISGLDDRV